MAPSWLSTAINVLVVVGVVVWISLVFWTWTDARRRIDDRFLIICSVSASLFPFVGTLVYLLVRPPEYRDEVRLRELELQITSARLQQLDPGKCPECKGEIDETYLRCPHCTKELKLACSECGKAVESNWKLCPHCAKELAPSSKQKPSQQSASTSKRRKRGSKSKASTEALLQSTREKAIAPKAPSTSNANVD